MTPHLLLYSLRFKKNLEESGLWQCTLTIVQTVLGHLTSIEILLGAKGPLPCLQWRQKVMEVVGLSTFLMKRFVHFLFVSTHTRSPISSILSTHLGGFFGLFFGLFLAFCPFSSPVCANADYDIYFIYICFYMLYFYGFFNLTYDHF